MHSYAWTTEYVYLTWSDQTGSNSFECQGYREHFRYNALYLYLFGWYDELLVKHCAGLSCQSISCLWCLINWLVKGSCPLNIIIIGLLYLVNPACSYENTKKIDKLTFFNVSKRFLGTFSTVLEIQWALIKSINTSTF